MLAYHSSQSKGEIRISRERGDDDWLADEGGVDWGFEYEDEEPELPQPSRARTGLVAPSRTAARAAPETYQRRRIVVGGAVGLAILIAIIIAVVASSGGGGSPSAVPTTEIVTQPVTPNPTPSPETTSPTTTGSSSLTVSIPADAGNISAGDSGDAVLALQKALKQLGYDVGTPDGKFGQGTQDAVKAFQTDHGLTPDGIVGQGTADAINSALASGSG